MYIVYLIWYTVLYWSEVPRSQVQSSSLSRSLTQAINSWYEIQPELFYEALKKIYSGFIINFFQNQ